MIRNTIINRRRPWYQSPILAVFFLIVIAWGTLVVVRMYIKYREARELRNQYQAELQELRTKQSELDTKLKELSTDRGMEAEVRNRFRVVRPGESLVIVVDNASGTEAAQNAAIQNKSHTDSELPKPSFFDKMRYFIGL